LSANKHTDQSRLDTVLTLAMLTAGAFLQSVGLLKKPQLVQWKGTSTQVRLQVWWLCVFSLFINLCVGREGWRDIGRRVRNIFIFEYRIFTYTLYTLVLYLIQYLRALGQHAAYVRAWFQFSWLSLSHCVSTCMCICCTSHSPYLPFSLSL
jgi:hypothetical protein